MQHPSLYFDFLSKALYDSESIETLNKLRNLYGPRQANLVLIAYASSEGSGEPAPAHTSSESRGTDRKPDPWPL